LLDLLRRNRDIRFLFGAQVVSYLGDWFTFVALAGLIDDLTGSKFLVSLVLVSLTLPSFLMSPVAGSFADRFDRRKIIFVVSIAQAIAALGFLLVDKNTVWFAFVCQSTISALAAFIGPASGAAIPNLVDDDKDLRYANSLFGSTWGIMLAVGAGLGGIFSSAFGRQASFVADALTFVVAAFLVSRITRPMQRERVQTPIRRVRPLADMNEAITLARHNKVILALLASKTTFAVGAGIVSQLAVLASDAFSAGDAGRGALLGARGVGSGLGPILAARLVQRDMAKLLRVCGWSGLGFSIAYLGVGLSPSLMVAVVFVALAHLGGGAQWTLSTLGLQMEAPDELRGRVIAGDFALVTLMLSLTSIAAGLVSESIGVRSTIVMFSCLAACAAITYLASTRSLRQRLRNASPQQ
jgi:MFS family permease